MRLPKTVQIPLLALILILTAIVIGLGLWFFTKSSGGMKKGNELSIEPVSKAVEGTVEYKIESRNHVAEGTAVTTYNSNPPNSGDHWPAPAKGGTYDSSLPDEQLVHNLEHGYIWISYRPDVAQDVKDALKKIVGDDNWKMVLEPRDKDDGMIALAAWGRVLKLDTPDYDKVKDFIRTYRNRGPEKTPD